MDVVELHAIFHGRVQGVGFRWTLVDYAQKYHLVGFTKNLANGTVEVVAQGPKDKLSTFLEAIKADSGLAKIDSIKMVYRTPKETFSEFRIAY